MNVINLLTNYLREKKGSVLPIAVLLFPLIMGMSGLGVDVSIWMMNKRNLQTAADAAAIAAAWEIANNFEDNVQTAALNEAVNNGYENEEGNSLNLVIGTTDGFVSVTADITQKAPILFSRTFISGDVYTSAAAATAIIRPTDEFCLLSLAETGSGAMTAAGAVGISAAGCGIAINSRSDSALDFSGDVDIEIGSVSIVGDYEIGGSVDFDYESMTTQAAAVADPYEDIDVPDTPVCSSADSQQPDSYNGDAALENDGLNPTVICGGLNISGTGTVTFEPGVYVIDGGDFSVTGSGTMVGEGVTFILTNSGNGDWGNINITGSKEITFTGPAEGTDYEGIVFYQDRNAPDTNGRENFLTGTSFLDIQGVIYTPSRDLDFGGNNTLLSSNSNPCTKVIAKTITLHGNPDLGNSCEGTGVRDIGSTSVKLVM